MAPGAAHPNHHRVCHLRQDVPWQSTHPTYHPDMPVAQDEPPPASYPLPKFRNIKGFVYLWPCDSNGGAGAVVPGSHILPDAPGQTLKIPMASGYNEKMGEEELPHTAMPNHVPFEVDAGDAAIFVRPGAPRGCFCSSTCSCSCLFLLLLPSTVSCAALLLSLRC